MDDLTYGTRDKRGDWKPNEPADIAPIWLSIGAEREPRIGVQKGPLGW